MFEPVGRMKCLFSAACSPIKARPISSPNQNSDFGRSRGEQTAAGGKAASRIEPAGVGSAGMLAPSRHHVAHNYTAELGA
jgi:hypothetical protein